MSDDREKQDLEVFKNISGNLNLSIVCPTCEKLSIHNYTYIDKFPYETNCRCGQYLNVLNISNLKEIEEKINKSLTEKIKILEEEIENKNSLIEELINLNKLRQSEIKELKNKLAEVKK